MPGAPAEDELLDGPIEGLTGEQNRIFLRGDIAFNDEIFTASTGLGPFFVATSCGTCHAGDGKGHPFTTLTREPHGRNEARDLEFHYREECLSEKDLVWCSGSMAVCSG